jgi:2-C-methyl-D-erythritol 4-phosphate cytidylyltransferase
MDYSTCGLVIVAAGKGSRFGGYKQLVPLIDKPLLIQTLEAFSGVPFAQRVVVLPIDFILQGTWDTFTRMHPTLRDFLPVAGREERALSVREGVMALSPRIDFVAVHDGARPLPPLGAMGQCLSLLKQDPDLGAAIVASPVTDTIKRVVPAGSAIRHTEDRSELVRAETPQLCRRSILMESFSHPQLGAARDEAQAIEFLGRRTAFVLHDGFNPKITHAKDMAVVSAWLTAHNDTTPEPRQGIVAQERAS